MDARTEADLRAEIERLMEERRRLVEAHLDRLGEIDGKLLGLRAELQELTGRWS